MSNIIKQSSELLVSNLKEIEKKMLTKEQIKLLTIHSLYNGVYTRTILLKENEVICGALIKIPTTLIINGNIQVSDGDSVVDIVGFDVFLCEPNRKQLMKANGNTSITMLFKTDAKTIEEAEQEFTDDFLSLLSRREDSINIIYKGE